MTEIPAGFEPLPTASPFNTAVGPYYCRHEHNQLVIGLAVESHHCNSAGHLHGAMMCAIADIALGHNIALALAEQAGLEPGVERPAGTRTPIATINLSTDFLGTARVGDWIEVHAEVSRTGRTLAFADAYVTSAGARIARASAVFRVLS